MKEGFQLRAKLGCLNAENEMILVCMSWRRIMTSIKHTITVAMAIYKPNIKWLEEELESINSQTYKDFCVLAWNDCPTDVYDYDELFKRHLSDIPFRIFKGDKNMGSNGAFEKLTAISDTPYIAYCDQDDIWCDDKLAVLLNTIKQENATLVYSDMIVIDEHSHVISQNIAGVRPRQKFYTGKNALSHLLAKNFVTGCTMMMKTDIAKAALPFPEFVFHDWWLAVNAALKGNIAMALKPLMKYRIYGGNQSAVLKGVRDKRSYYEIRIKKQKDFIEYINKTCNTNHCVTVAMEWNLARENYFLHPNIDDFKKLLSGWNFNPSTVFLEALLPIIPEVIFKNIISAVKNGKL